MKRIAVAGVAGIAVFGAIFGAAASLGGVSSSNLGAGSAVVASCDTNGVTTTYGTGSRFTGETEVQNVIIGGVSPACDGHTLVVALTDTHGTHIEQAGATVDPTGFGTGDRVVTVFMRGLALAEHLGGVHITIY